MLTDAEIAGHMKWRGPGAYTASAMRKIKAAMVDAIMKDREAIAVRFDREPSEQWRGDEIADEIRARNK